LKEFKDKAMIDIEAITQIVNNINEAKDALELATNDRADAANELIELVLNEEEIEPEFVDKLRQIDHEIDVANETIEASKRMLIAMIEEDGNEGELL
jgi:hypothetical protein